MLGTGERIRFPHPRLTRALTDVRIGLDVMDTPAACRTFNILAAEGRKVVVAILIDADHATTRGSGGAAETPLAR